MKPVLQSATYLQSSDSWAIIPSRFSLAEVIRRRFGEKSAISDGLNISRYHEEQVSTGFLETFRRAGFPYRPHGPSLAKLVCR